MTWPNPWWVILSPTGAGEVRMIVQQWRLNPYPSTQRPPEIPGGGSTEPINWRSWLRGIEAKRRAAGRAGPVERNGFPSRAALGRLTRVSFQMDGIELSARMVDEALSRGAASRGLRSRQAQRVRNHAAIVLRVLSLARRSAPLTPGMVVRWYASIGCGLSTAGPDEAALARLVQVVRQVSSPPAPLRPALEDVARLHWELMSEPFVPGFNGILARLLLTYHLGRCGMPPVIFDPPRDLPYPTDPTTLLRRLLQRIEEAYGDAAELDA